MPLSRIALALTLLGALLMTACGGGGGPGSGRPDLRKIPTATPYATLPPPTIVTGGGAAPGPQGGENTYVVEPGDSLSAIADKLGTSLEELIRLNDLADPSRLEVGQVLKVPARAGTSGSATPRAPSTPRSTPRPRTTPQPDGETQTYVVQSGDNASDIADRFGVTLEELAEANDTTVSELRSLEVGQELKIPPPSSTPEPEATEEPTEEPTPEETPTETPPEPTQEPAEEPPAEATETPTPEA